MTVVDTLAMSYVAETSVEAGTAAGKAEVEKVKKYSQLASNYRIVPLGFETCGSWGPEAASFVNEVGTKLCSQTGERRSTSFLKQRISIAIQRGNASSILGTFGCHRGLDEVFYVLRGK